MNTSSPLSRLALTALPLLLLSLTGCEEDASRVQALQEEMKALEEKDFKTRQELTRLKSQTSALEGERDKLKEEKSKLEGEVEAARKNLDALKKQFEDYKGQYKVSIRKNAGGMELGDLLVEGRAYKNVKVREVQDDSVYVSHEGGLTNFPWRQLSEKLQFLLAYRDPSPIIEAKEAVTYQTSQSVIASTPVSKLSHDDFQRAVAEHDARVSGVESEIRKKTEDMLAAKRSRSDAEADHRVARSKKQPLVDIERAINAYSMQITQLDAEIDSLEKKKRDLQKDDPRKKRLSIR